MQTFLITFGLIIYVAGYFFTLGILLAREDMPGHKKIVPPLIWPFLWLVAFGAAFSEEAQKNKKAK